MSEGLQPGRQVLTADEYHADRSAVSKGWLDKIERSAAHLKAWLDGYAKPATPTQALGKLTHVAVLEPDLLTAQFITKPTEINRRTKVGREEYAAWEIENAHKTIITDDQMAVALAVRDSVNRHKAARALLGDGSPEETMVWRNGETGELCKARADWLSRIAIVDAKTTHDARPAEFAKSIVNYRYDVQTGHYLEGFQHDLFAWIAVEVEPPYAVAVYVADAVIRQRGLEARDRNLRTYAECKAKNEWPAYPDVVTTIELPRWAR
jgi:exodeoxyribonuclease VIII